MDTLLGLWTLVIVGAVLGRLLDPSAKETLEESPPGLRRALAAEWREEFFRRVSSRTSLDDLSNPLLTQTRRGRSSRGHFDPSGGYAPSFYPEPVGGRINTRHFDVGGVKVPPWRAQVRGENLEWMLNHVFMYPRSHVTNETAKEVVRKYISDSFQITSGVSTSIQYFQPVQFLSIYEGTTLPTGANIIGIIRGREWGTPADRPIVIGAHWDTVNFTPGTDDNGSGVAAMLEICRAISQSGCKPRFSIMFVAFDLEEVGSQGSLVFIKNYLMKVLRRSTGPGTTFQGAYILDSIMDWNSTRSSQMFPTDQAIILPAVYDQLADEGFRGDFLALIHRAQVDQRLADKFQEHWRSSSHHGKFKLKPFPLRLSADLPDLDILADHLNFLRSDHSRFWYMNDTEVPSTLQAVLLTDTGPFRGLMTNCYHSVCDSPEVNLYRNPDNLAFLLKTAQTLTDTVVELSECSLDNDPLRRGAFGRGRNRGGAGKSESPLKSLLNFARWMSLAKGSNGSSR